MRVGSSNPIKINARIIAATNKKKKKMVAENVFRQDLLYRLSVVKIRVPTLSERRSDIAVLSKAIVKSLGQELGKPNVVISKDALNYLSSLSWPGNIRQLRNVIERAIVMTDSNIIDIDSFNICIERKLNTTNALDYSVTSNGLIETLENIEKELISKALKKHGGVKSRAADDLKIPRTQLLYRMKRLGLTK